MAFISTIGHQKRTSTQKSYPDFSLGGALNSRTQFIKSLGGGRDCHNHQSIVHHPLKTICADIESGELPTKLSESGGGVSLTSVGSKDPGNEQISMSR